MLSGDNDMKNIWTVTFTGINGLSSVSGAQVLIDNKTMSVISGNTEHVIDSDSFVSLAKSKS